MMKTPVGIAAKNLAAADDGTLLGALRAYYDQTGVQAADPVNAWTRPEAARGDRQLSGSQEMRQLLALPVILWDRPYHLGSV